jgi:hypothetical protein
MSSFTEPSNTWTRQALGNHLDWCIEVLGTHHRQVRRGARNQGRWPRLWLVGARSSGVIAPSCLELITPLRTYRVRSFPVRSELERRPGSEWLELGVQGLSHRVVWRTHRERPSPVRSELEWQPGSEWLELGVQKLSHWVIWRTHRERPSHVRFELERQPGSKWLELGVQGLSHRVVWQTHQERPSPVRLSWSDDQDLSGWS